MILLRRCLISSCAEFMRHSGRTGLKMPMHLPFRSFVLCLAAIAVTTCGGPQRGIPRGAMGQLNRPPTEQEQNIRYMLSFDGNSDGTVTRDEMEAALRRQYEACDLNHDGRVDLREMQIENDRRYKA